MASFALAMLAFSHRADAFVNVGAEAGIIKRSANSPNNLKLGFGYGLHGEVDLLPLLKIGPYYLHYELPSDDRPLPGARDAAFNTLGLRARVMLPVPGNYKPYAFAGLGYTWVNYSTPTDALGHFWEVPIGVGVAYEVIPLLQISLDVAYRPGMSFGGTAFDSANISHPTSGYSVLLGAAINL